MKKSLSKSSKKGLIILLAILAAAFAIYMAVCDYAGLSGNIAFFHVNQSSEITKYPRWFIHGILSGTLMLLCLYAIYRITFKKKRYGTLLLSFFLLCWGNILFSLNSKELWAVTICLILPIGSLFAFANIPGMMSRAITRHLIFQDSDIKEDAETLCSRQLRKMEWIRFYPLKKVFIGGIWLFFCIITILSIIMYKNESSFSDLAFIAILFVITSCTSGKVWRYIKIPYHCVPILNQSLSKQEIRSLIQGEQFALIPFENKNLQKYVPILVSENWALIEGLLISRKLALKGYIHHPWIPSEKSNHINIIYLNGKLFQTRAIDMYLNGKSADEMIDTLYHITKIHFPLCSTEKITQKYNSILPEIQNPKEKLWYLLTHDVNDIKQAYIAMFPPKTKPKNKCPQNRKNQDEK